MDEASPLKVICCANLEYEVDFSMEPIVDIVEFYR
jgi:hypothetical protein